MELRIQNNGDYFEHLIVFFYLELKLLTECPK